MIRLLPIMLFVAFVVSALAGGVAYCQDINPYLPRNAVAAEPFTPYNLNFNPCKSPTLVHPYPFRIPGSRLLPDLPPICEPIYGPLGLPIPLPVP